MNHIDLAVGVQTRELLNSLRTGQFRGFRSRSYHGDRRLLCGFHCATNQDGVQMFAGVAPRQISDGIFLKGESVTAYVTYGAKAFDHTNEGPGGPDWRLFPRGLRSPLERKPYPAALVYGDALITQQPLALRMYWGVAGQTADEFRAELLALLQNTER